LMWIIRLTRSTKYARSHAFNSPLICGDKRS
jgi:hypothetical protein